MNTIVNGVPPGWPKWFQELDHTGVVRHALRCIQMYGDGDNFMEVHGLAGYFHTLPTRPDNLENVIKRIHYVFYLFFRFDDKNDEEYDDNVMREATRAATACLDEWSRGV